MNVPQLRFKGFEGEWPTYTLGEVGDVTKLAGFEFTSHIVYADKGDIIALRGLNVKNGRLYLENVKYIDGSNFDKLSRSKLLINDLLFTYVGTIGELAIIDENDKYYLAPNVSRIRVIKEKVNSLFLMTLLSSSKFYKKIIFPLIATSSQPALSMENIRKFSLHIPSLEEQKKIATLFDLLNKKIEKQQEKIEKLEQFKKGMMQKIFSQELRFKDEGGGEFPEWERKNLGQIANVIMGQSPKGENYSTDSQNTVLIQGNADMKNGKVVPRIYTSEITKVCLPGDIIMSVRAPVGEIALTDIEACIGRGVCAIRGSEYIYHYLSHFNSIKAWKSLSQGSTFESISGNDIKTLLIPVPSLKEQKKISYYLTVLERKVIKESQKLIILEEQKKGFMQRLFI